MLHNYKKLSISTKLGVTVISTIIPLIILTIFIDSRYRHDINIGQVELAGTQALRKAFDIQNNIANHLAFNRLNNLPPQTSARFQLQSKNPAIKIEESLKQLSKRQTRMPLSPTRNPARSSVYYCIDVKRVTEAWKWYISSKQMEAYKVLQNVAQQLITQIANCAKLALDPALDSQMLARATITSLPLGDAVMSEFQIIALDFMQANPNKPVLILSDIQEEKAFGNAAFFKYGILKPLLDNSHIAITEDINFYTSSPTLELRYAVQLKQYQLAANRFLESISRLQTGQTTPEELFNSASNVRTTGCLLFKTAMDELDILIQQRIQRYQQWRLISFAVSGSGILLALLLSTATTRSITRGINAVGNYAQNVANGDYDSLSDNSDLGPLLTTIISDIDNLVAKIHNKTNEFDSLLAAITTPCFMVDREERIIFANKQTLQLTGLGKTISDIMGKKLATIVYGDPDHKTLVGQALTSKTAVREQKIDHTTPTGEIRHIQYDITPLTNQFNKITGAFVVMTDLTPIIEKEKSIARLAAFPREAPDPMLSAGSDGKIHYLNTATQSLFEKNNLINIESALPENHREIIQHTLSSNKDRSGIESKIGNKSFSWTYHPLPSQDIVHLYATDITERIQVESQLLHDAFHDALTDLPNKTLFLDRVNQALRRTRRRDINFAILFIDLDGFKNINDGLGHNVGDKLLAQFAWRIKDLLGPDETIARLGGDEFTILLPMVSDDQHSMQIANRIQGDLKRPFTIDGTNLFVSASIGVINAPNGSSNANDLLRDAETAMYHAKSAGRAKSRRFEPTMHKDATTRLRLENDLKQAVELEEFEPYYQPIISLKTGTIIGFEALIRWNHPEHGLVPPDQFIPLAEETGLIVPMGVFMLQKACWQVKYWQETFSQYRDLAMSVNMSVIQMNHPTITNDVVEVIETTKISPASLKIEITESTLMGNVVRAAKLLKTFEDMGVGLMIDDFGTGYSSLSHLHQFPFHYLKIDRTFVSSMEEKTDNMAIIRSIISLAHTLDKSVVAEGVETHSQQKQLAELGCEQAQGYFFSRPLSADKAEALLAKSPVW